MNPTLIAYAIIALISWTGLVSTGAYFKGKAQCRIEIKAAEKDRVETVLDTRGKNEHESNHAAATTIVEVEKIRWKTRDIIREIPVYVSSAGDRGCIIPGGFVRLHDMSASGSGLTDNPNAAGELYDAPSGIALSTVGETIAENYGSCREEMTRFRGLQKWVETYCR